MIYKQFQDKQLSQLGFGTMRLPLLADGVTIDEAQVETMTAYAIEHGINYFDTAYPYHQGNSERVIGRVLSKYPRESFYLATKYPGHQIASSYDPAAIFEEQLQKCGVEYFDFYLLHNVNVQSAATYLDPRWGIIDYFREQKRLGRIRHLGFSCHADLKGLEEFLDAAGDSMEFCQIQLNYLDWTLQNARGKYQLLTERGIPVWVMEPVRGGKLAALDAGSEAKLKAARPESSVASWGFRFLQALPNVKMILSGMSNMEQMQDNVSTFADRQPLTEAETALILEIAEKLKDSVPCTACRYCCDGCPMELDIPGLIGVLNELKISPSVNSAIRVEFAPEDKKPTACISCGQCVQICPQNIDIPRELKNLTEAMKNIPSWVETCRQREAAAKQN